MVVFCAIASAVTVLIFGVLPAYRVSHGNLGDLLKTGARQSGSAQHYRLQDALVVLQVAVALVLLTAAGLLTRGFERFYRADQGFQSDGVLTAEIGLSAAHYGTAARQADLVAVLVQDLSKQPSIVAAGAGSSLPGASGPVTGFSVAGEPPPEPGQLPITRVIAATPGYFRTMGIRLVQGRDLLPTDDARAPKVAVIDQSLARRFVAGQGPLGQRLLVGGDTLSIVGVVASVKEEPGLAVHGAPQLYLSFAQYPDDFAYVVARTVGAPRMAVAVFRHTVASLDQSIPISDLETMSQRVVDAVASTRFSSWLASLFAVVALVLGSVGIYSVLAFTVAHRRRDIAVRIALGAGHSRVVLDVVRRALFLTFAGMMLGSAVAWGLARVLETLLLGVSPHDPVAFAGAAGLFALVATLAASLPALRTTRVNPVTVLTSS